MALFRAKTVNLAELATVWGGNAEEASNYKRMQRFFKSFEVNMDKIAKMVMSIAGIPQPWILSIDRTNWSFGTTDKVRLSKLLALLAIAFVWAMKAGLWRHSQDPIRIINAHGRRASSLFRYGFDLLRRFFIDPPQSLLESEFSLIHLLSCT